MPDLLHSVKQHRKNLQKIWRSAEWREAKSIFLTFHKDNKCERCRRVGTIVPGHSSEDYFDMATYIQKVRENRCEALCPECNRKEQKGLKPCPSCVKAYQATDGQVPIHYIKEFYDVCYTCSDPGERKMAAKEQEEFQKFVRKVRDADNAKRRNFYQTVIRTGRVKQG